jgi:hypothetical protein
VNFELLQHLGRDAVYMINFKGGERGDLLFALYKPFSNQNV